VHQRWQFGENKSNIFQDIVLTMYRMHRKMHGQPECIMPPVIHVVSKNVIILLNEERKLKHSYPPLSLGLVKQCPNKTFAIKEDSFWQFESRHFHNRRINIHQTTYLFRHLHDKNHNINLLGLYKGYRYYFICQRKLAKLLYIWQRLESLATPLIHAHAKAVLTVTLLDEFYILLIQENHSNWNDQLH